MKHFKLKSIDSGFDRIYYTTVNTEKRTILFCLQDARDIKLYRCSRDGEPSHEVEVDMLMPCEFELPTGETELELAAIAWIRAIDSKLKPIQLENEQIKSQDTCKLIVSPDNRWVHVVLNGKRIVSFHPEYVKRVLRIGGQS